MLYVVPNHKDYQDFFLSNTTYYIRSWPNGLREIKSEILSDKTIDEKQYNIRKDCSGRREKRHAEKFHLYS